MSVAELNRKYFDAISDSYDAKPWFAAVNTKVAHELRSRLSWIDIPFANTGSQCDASSVRLLDYACGTGLMTRTFGPYVTQTLAIDISPNMVSAYQSRALSAGLPATTITAVTGDLFDKSNPQPPHLAAPEWWDFDIAAVGFGFHHFEDVEHAARQLKERLRPGGVLVINDFLEGGDVLADGEGNPVQGSEGNHAVHKHGHGHGHGNAHSHGHAHAHGNHAHTPSPSHEHKHKHPHTHPSSPSDQGPSDQGPSDQDPSLRQKMTNSIVVPHFTLAGVRAFFTAAGYVDVDAVSIPERVYMEFGGQKMWRTILIAKGRRPGGKSEL